MEVSENNVVYRRAVIKTSCVAEQSTICGRVTQYFLEREEWQRIYIPVVKEGPAHTPNAQAIY
jgi:hypothetical protein